MISDHIYLGSCSEVLPDGSVLFLTEGCPTKHVDPNMAELTPKALPTEPQHFLIISSRSRDMGSMIPYGCNGSLTTV